MTVVAGATRALRLSALYAAAFALIGVYMPFFPIWLESRGLDAATIGVVLAVPIVIRIVVTTPLMSLADRAFGPRRLLIACQFGLALVFPVMFLAEGPAAIGFLVALGAVGQAVVVPASDLVVTTAVRSEPRLNYGRIRLWGSITFLIMSIATGYLIGWTSADAILVLLAALALVGIGATLLAVPGGGGARTAVADPTGDVRPRLPAALWCLIAAAACTQASHAALYSFGSIYWRDLGLSGPAIGILWAVGVMAEIVLFATFGRAVGRSGGAVRLVVVGAAASMLRFMGMAAAPGLPVTVGLQLLHGLSFGATHLGAMAAISELAPPEARGRAQGTLSAGMALAMAASTAASGALFDRLGPMVFAAMVPLGAAGIVLALAAARVISAQTEPSTAQP